MALLLNAGDTVSRSYSYTQPSPLHPSQPQGTGERTGNLLNLNRTYSNLFTTDTTKWMNGAATVDNVGISYAETEIIGDVIKVTSKISGYGASFLIEASPNTTYTVSFETDKVSSGSYCGISDRDINGTVISNITAQGKSATFTTHDSCAFLNVCFRFPTADGTVTFSNIMLNTGSQPLPYEPYGQYKIPISSGGLTTPVYLGEMETTRRIKKLVLTGEESWILYNNNYFSTITDSNSKNNNICVCSHLISSPSAGIYIGSGTARLKVFSRDVSSVSSDLDTFKTWLATQYAAGTPVTVWYVLATPTTGIVNEPLMKIGEYADEVSGITIPTIAGENTLSVDTTLQPSEATVNYKGWHPVQSVHERENGAWT